MDEMQSDFYTKTEVDEKFGISTGNDNVLDFYTKSEIIENIGTPETLVLPPDMLDFYNKTEIDSIQTAPEYSDTDKVTIILLDGNLQRTTEIRQFTADYVSPLASAKSFLQSNSANKYDVVIGEDFMNNATGGVTNVIQNSGFIDCPNIVHAEIYCTSTGYGTTYVEGLGDTFFRNCTSLINVKLPASLRKIDRGAFRGCTSLTEIIIPDTVQTIENNALSYTPITNIIIPASVTTIGETAFTNCFSIQSFIINKEQDSISGAPWTMDYNTPYPYSYIPPALPITWTG